MAFGWRADGPRGGFSVNIKQLRYVSSILSTGSFSSAAAHEGVSVQAVSKSMAELEGELGQPLFTRSSQGVTPTQLGKAFAARARRVLDEYDALDRFVSSHGREGDPARRFRLGLCVPAFTGIEKICAIADAVTSKALGLKVDLAVVPTESCVDDLREGRLDALITVGMVREPGIVCGSLGTMLPFVVMAETNPLAQKDEVALADINSCPVALSTTFDQFNESVCLAYVERGMTSELVEVSSTEDFLDLLVRRNGLSFIVGGDFVGPFEGCVTRPIAVQDRMPIPICLSSLEGAGVSYLDLARALAKLKILS